METGRYVAINYYYKVLSRLPVEVFETGKKMESSDQNGINVQDGINRSKWNQVVKMESTDQNGMK